jgi:O-methyltransferase
MLNKILSLETRRKIRKYLDRKTYKKLYTKYRGFTMIPEKFFLDNLEVCAPLRFRSGCIVECGVWRGGMIAALTEVMGKDRNVYLFDSFEGLPPAGEKDGEGAKEYQKNTTAIDYFDNCRAEMDYSLKAMEMASASHPNFIKGYFENTLPGYEFPEPIIVLRLDADWYDSTMQCLENLYDKVAPGGIILVDDYYYWDGCTRAVHDFLSKKNHPTHIHETAEGVCYFYKY